MDKKNLKPVKDNLDELSWKQLAIKAYRMQIMIVAGFFCVLFIFIGVIAYKILSTL